MQNKKRLHFLIFQDSMGYQKKHNHLNNLEIILITDYLFIVLSKKRMFNRSEVHFTYEQIEIYEINKLSITHCI